MFGLIPWKVVGLIGGACLAPFTGGTSLYVSMAVCGGIGLVAGHFLDDDKQKKEKENQQLALNTQVSKEVRDQIHNLQEDRSKEVSNMNTLDQQLAQKQNKLNDPNISEQEKAQIRSEIASIVSQRGSIEQKIKNYDKQIEQLIKNLPAMNGSGNQIDTQKLLIIGGAGLVIFLLLKNNREK